MEVEYSLTPEPAVDVSVTTLQPTPVVANSFSQNNRADPSIADAVEDYCTIQRFRIAAKENTQGLKAAATRGHKTASVHA